MADEKKDVIVPSAGNEKLQPGSMLSGVSKGLDTSSDMFAKISQIEKFSSSVAAAEKKEEPVKVGPKPMTELKLNGPVGEHMAKVRGSTLLDKPQPTPKKNPQSGPPTYHKGINSSGVNSRMKNSSFGRGVPFSANADYGPMWKNTSRLASVAIGNGESETTSLGLYHSPFNLNGFTMQGFAFNGAMPHVSSQSTIKGMQSTFHIAQDQDK